MALSVSKRIVSILDTAQNGHHNESKLVKELKQLEETHSAQKLLPALLHPLKLLLLVPKKEPSVDRCMKLIAHFAATGLVRSTADSSSDGDEVENSTSAVPLLRQLIAYHKAKNKAVRMHVCQLIAMILEMALDINDEITLPEDVSDSIQVAMMCRIYDRSPAVRAQAVLALRRFQDVQDLECPVLSCYVQLLQKDTAVEVRKAVLTSIGLNKRTLPVIIEHTRDVSASLRQMSFIKLAESCTIRHLSISQRVRLLQDGLQDRNNDVQEACICHLLRSWSQTLEDDFLRLLQCCDVEASPQVAELALLKLFEYIDDESLVESMEAYMQISVSPNGEGDKENTPTIARATKFDNRSACLHSVPIELLSPEVTFYWRCLCQYLKSKGSKGEQFLERVLPMISDYCDYLIGFHAKVLSVSSSPSECAQAIFIAEQLFAILLYMDYSDEVGRRCLGSTAVRLMTSSKFPAALIGAIMKSQDNIWPQPSVRIEKVLEVIAEIGQPLEGTLLASQTLMSEGEESSQNPETAPSDPETILKCLGLTSELLRGLKATKLTSSLQMLCETLILPSLPNEDPLVRDSALSSLALMCVLYKATALNHFYLLLQVSRIDHEGVQATALKAVFDLLLTHGFEAFKSEQNMSEVKQSGKAEGSTVVDEDINPDGDSDLSGSEGDPPSCGEDQEAGLETLEDEQGRDETTQKIINIITEFLDTESSLLRCTAGEGLAKLLLNGHILSRKVLAKLLLLWYNPLIQDEDRLRAVLGIFFQSFAVKSRANKEVLCEVFVPVLRTIVHAPPSSPLSTVDANRVVDLLVQLTTAKGTADRSEKFEGLHHSLAVQVANEALRCIQEPSVRVYCRALGMLDIDVSDEDAIKPLKVLAEDIIDNIGDRIGKRYVEKFNETMTLKQVDTIQSPAESPPKSAGDIDVDSD